MAHVGKVYPYLPYRDLSLSPGQTWGLPQSWLWSGILGTGTLAPYIVGKTFRIDLNSYSYSQPGLCTWQKLIASFGGSNYWVKVWYRLTYAPSMSEMQFSIGDLNFNAVNWTWRDTTSAWPYNQMQPPFIVNVPAQFNCSYGGTLVPAPWSTF